MTPDPQNSNIPELPPDSIQQPLSDDPSPSRGLQMNPTPTDKDSGSGEDELDNILSPFFKENLPWQEKLYGELYTALSAYTQRQVLARIEKIYETRQDLSDNREWSEVLEDEIAELKKELNND
jgi:hypothetical protein